MITNVDGSVPKPPRNGGLFRFICGPSILRIIGVGGPSL